MKNDIVSMRAFAEAFFAEFDAEVHPDGEDMLVILPPELTEAFGKPRLYLTFADEVAGQEQELSPEEDLFAYGSRTFDVMLSLLAGRGEKTHLRLPPTQSTDLDLSLAFVPRRNPPQVEETTFDVAEELFFAFHFRVEYLWAEKEEDFVTVVLDETGAYRPDKFAGLLDGKVPRSVDLPFQVEAETLRQQFERAGAIVQARVENRAKALQSDIEVRLGKIARRLDTFYGRMMAELDTSDADKDRAARADLQADRDRKLADEAERHRLQITVTPVSHALMLIPMARHMLRVANSSDTDKAHTLELRRDLASGQVELYRCLECDTDVKGVVLQVVSPGKTCSLRRRQTSWACLAVAGSMVEPVVVPIVEGIDPVRYQWWKVEDRESTVYLGEPRGSAIVSSLRGSALIAVDKQGRVIRQDKINVANRIFRQLRR